MLPRGYFRTLSRQSQSPENLTFPDFLYEIDAFNGGRHGRT